jgi:hypothetical protein
LVVVFWACATDTIASTTNEKAVVLQLVSGFILNRVSEIGFESDVGECS